MTLVEVIAEELLEPVGICLTEFVKYRLSFCNHLIQIRIFRKISPVVILAVSVSRSLDILESAFQFQLLVCLHHLDSSPASESDAAIEVVCNHGVTVCSSDGCDFKHSVRSLGTIKGTGHSVFQNLYVRNVQRVQSHEGIGRNYLTVKHIQRFIGDIALSERGVSPDTDLRFGTEVSPVGDYKSGSRALKRKGQVHHRTVLKTVHIHGIYDTGLCSDVQVIDVLLAHDDGTFHHIGIVFHLDLDFLLAGILDRIRLHPEKRGLDYDFLAFRYLYGKISVCVCRSPVLDVAADINRSSCKRFIIAVCYLTG